MGAHVATITHLHKGLGGRETTTIYSPTPEIFTRAGTWRTLPGATSDLAYGNVGLNWSYPHAYQMLNNAEKVFLLSHDGNTFEINTVGDGMITKLTKKTFASNPKLPSVMFSQGKLLSLRNGARAVVVDINGSAPVISNTATMSQQRLYSNATVLADGKVMVNGGSSVGNVLDGAAYATEIWDPQTGQWTLGALAAKPRRYHSNSLLLQDGSVFTGGGGAPGPVRNMNAEIYYPRTCTTRTAIPRLVRPWTARPVH